jgi:hypothetical protein
MRLIENVEQWMSLRELRNSNVHDYEEDELMSFHEALLIAAPKVLAVRSQIK